MHVSLSLVEAALDAFLAKLSLYLFTDVSASAACGIVDDSYWLLCQVSTYNLNRCSSLLYVLVHLRFEIVSPRRICTAIVPCALSEPRSIRPGQIIELLTLSVGAVPIRGEWQER